MDSCYHRLAIGMIVFNCATSYRLTGANFTTLEYLCDVFWILWFRANLSVVLLRLSVKLSIAAVLFWFFLSRKTYPPTRHLFHYIHTEVVKAIQDERNNEVERETGVNPNTPPPTKDPVLNLSPCKTTYENKIYKMVFSSWLFGVLHGFVYAWFGYTRT